VNEEHGAREPLRILLVTHQRRSRINTRALPWARALAARGHAIDVMCHADRERWKTVYEQESGLRIIHNPDMLVGALRQGWDPVCALRRAALLFREKRAYHIIHCLDTRPAVVLPSLAYAHATRTLIVSDWVDWWGRGGLITEKRPLWYRVLFGRFETFFEEHFRRRLDGLTTISSALLERGVTLGVPRERCLRLPGGADLSATFSTIPSKEDSLKALNIPAGASVVCFSGLDVLIDLPLALCAFERVAAARPGTVLLLVGPAPGLMHKLASNRSRGRIICTGPVPYAELPKYLAAADVFLMPYANKISNVGRWPNKVGDYMCIGRPTVSNPIGEVKRLFEEFGIGTLAAETADSMANAVLALLDNPERARILGQQARATAVNVFAWERLIEDLERWYYRILSMGAAPARQSLPSPHAPAARG
jgi:glycosyltransferase involved in cell wall biosynthesis